MKSIINSLEEVDAFKQPQVIPFIKSNEKEKGSILGGILTILSFTAFGVYVTVLLTYFLSPYSNDDYSLI